MRNSLIRHSPPFRPDTLKCEGARPRACLSRYSVDRAGKGFPGVTLPADGGPVPPSRRHPAWYYIQGHNSPFLASAQAQNQPKIGSFSLEQRETEGASAAGATKIDVKTCAACCRLKLASFDSHPGIATDWPC